MKWNDLKTIVPVAQIKLQPEDVKNAKSYLPLLHKQALAEALSDGCIEDSIPVFDGIPPRKQRNIIGQKLVLCAVLCGIYLGLYDVSSLYNDEPSFSFSLLDYDQFASVPFQLEAMRRSKSTEIRKKAEEILSDFAEFQKLLNATVDNKIAAYNDPCARLMQILSAQVTPESVQDAVQQLEGIKSELSKLKENPDSTEDIEAVS